MTQAVDLRPGADGDRIAVIRGGEVSYLPAARVDIGATHAGASGSCRYTRRSANGDLYVCGPGLKRTLFRSTDGGATWSGRRYDLGMDRFELRQMPRDIEDGWIGAFTILSDETFLMNVMPSNHRTNAESYLARSNDYGATWSVERMDLPLGGYRGVAAGNSDLVELADGTLLLTMDLWFCAEEGEKRNLPAAQQGIAAYVLRSTDGGRSWPEMHCVALHAAEVHLLELPSGTLLSAIRRQRWVRLPGDPTDITVAMRAHGYDPEYRGVEEPEIGVTTSLYKHVAVSESTDGGRTWVNERRVTDYEQCSGELTLLADASTLVLTYDHRFHDRFSRAGVRARVSHDLGATWEADEYVLGEGENYPGGLAMDDGTLIIVCPYRDRGPIQAVRWRPASS